MSEIISLFSVVRPHLFIR